MLPSNAESPSKAPSPAPRPHSHNLDLALIVLIITINSAAFIYQADHNLDVRADVDQLRSELEQLVDRTQAPSRESDFAAILPTLAGAMTPPSTATSYPSELAAIRPAPKRSAPPRGAQLAQEIRGSTPDPTN